MRKLKLESLQVESFETTSPARAERGTVEGHADVDTGTRDTGPSYCVVCYAETHDPNICLDRTYGCTRLYNTCGANYCWIDNTADCTS